MITNHTIITYFGALLCMLTIFICSCKHDQIPLWPNDTANQQKSAIRKTFSIKEDKIITEVNAPTITTYFPRKTHQSGTSILICPGGGYKVLMHQREGTAVAKYLNSKGITAFVLSYRLPKPKTDSTSSQFPLLDAQRAIRLIRSQASQLNINPNRIGIMGFSAGGHLASTLGTQYKFEGNYKKDAIDKLSARPDFIVLAYPVITMKDDYTAKDGKLNLLGNNPHIDLINQFSNELHVSDNTPPTFLVHAENDPLVPIENSIRFYDSLKAHHIYCNMVSFSKGAHGFGLGLYDDQLKTWPEEFLSWLNSIEQ
ncbi:alpha/beta hydrolase [Bacteroidales bacterium]|nr:alpha/beta hydrolase [Bacteroidales bacterium]